MTTHPKSFKRLIQVSALVVGAWAGCGPSLHTPTLAPVKVAAQAKPHPRKDPDANEVLQKYCLTCHGQGKARGGLSLDELIAGLASNPDHARWQAVVEQVEGFQMPPDDEAQPTPEERDLLTHWIDAKVLRFDCTAIDPGRTTAHRLNRQEYENSVHELLGIDMPLKALLPADTSGYGFDNIANALSSSPLLVERYLDAADAALNAAFYDPATIKPHKQTIPSDLAEAGHGTRPRGDGWMILNSDQEDELGIDVETPFATQYRLRVFAENWTRPPIAGAPPRPPPDAKNALSITVKHPVISFVVDDKPQHQTRFGRQRKGWFEAVLNVPAGKHHVSVAAKRDPSALALAAQGETVPPGLALPPSFRMEMAVRTLQLEGPLAPPAERGPGYKKVFIAEAKDGNRTAAASAIISRFAGQAYRRPLGESELPRLLRVAQDAWSAGASFDMGVRRALAATLVSAPFLFRFDRDPAQGPPTQVVPLTDHDLASRLSYFLWSSPPDQSLRADADAGRLRQTLTAQVNRMLDNPKARNFVMNFGGQWLQFRNIDDAAPAFFLFKKFDEPLREAMKEETVRFFGHVLANNKSVLDFLRADYTFANEILAKHYGLADVVGPNFREVSLASTPRRGVLTHASILTITSSSTRTSPVKRGKWVLETLLNAPPPPPPPDVPELPEGRDVKGSVRHLLEEHRKNPACATCHARMDPIGFGLENFDAIGEFRTKDKGEPVDASGEFGGKAFKNSAELLQILSETKGEVFVKAFTSRLLTYALGRGLAAADKCVVESIMQATQANGYRFRDFILAVVQSPLFLYTRGDDEPARQFRIRPNTASAPLTASESQP